MMAPIQNRNTRKKSLKERFLLIIGVFFFLVYLGLGLAVIFWERFPLRMEMPYRIAFGALIVLYAGVRFSRLLKANGDED
jgi:hypothetical protein